MISKKVIFFILLIGSTGSVSTVVFADTQMHATIEKTTYTYCERLVYTIEVSEVTGDLAICLLYTSPSPRDRQKSRMPSSA